MQVTPDLDSEELGDVGSLHLYLAHLELKVLQPFAQNCVGCKLKLTRADKNKIKVGIHPHFT
jgi:hypothetical protein